MPDAHAAFEFFTLFRQMLIHVSTGPCSGIRLDGLQAAAGVQGAK